MGTITSISQNYDLMSVKILDEILQFTFIGARVVSICS